MHSHNKRSQCDIYSGAFCMPVATLAYKNHLHKSACCGRYVQKSMHHEMESNLFLLIILVLAVIALLPCFLFWLIALKLLPQRYKLKPILYTLICCMLTLTTGFALNLELEGGALSGVIAIFVFSLLWAFLLALANFVAQVISNRKIKSNV